jgi:uncharacterized protein YjaG (DUF416 family)
MKSDRPAAAPAMRFAQHRRTRQLQPTRSSRRKVHSIQSILNLRAPVQPRQPSFASGNRRLTDGLYEGYQGAIRSLSPGRVQPQIGVAAVRIIEEFARNIGERLEALGPRKTAAFLASCAERLMPLYRQFCTEQKWDTHSHLQDALDYVWESLLQISPEGNLRTIIMGVEEQLPYAHSDSALITAAQNCMFCIDVALRYLLDTHAQLSGSPWYAVEAVTSVEYRRLKALARFDSTSADDILAETILATVHRELLSQSCDVETLEASNHVSDAVDVIRVRARNNAYWESRV